MSKVLNEKEEKSSSSGKSCHNLQKLMYGFCCRIYCDGINKIIPQERGKNPQLRE